ncbi:Uncharacterised protein [Acinetobacter baumannii]|nr:Uncharacterised protein [Acinetobacter baumannii]
MSWSRRWTACADGSSAAPGAWSAPFAALRHPRLFALAGPAVLGSLQGGPGHPQRRPIPARSLCRLESYSTHARSARFALQSFHRAAGVHGRMTGHGRGRLAGVSAAWMPRTSPHGRVHGVPCKPAPPVTSRYCGTCQPRGGSARWPGTPHHLNSTRLIARVPMPATRPYTVSWPLA